MNLKEQTYVSVLAECGNITKAADRLYISQPALSIYINNLEKSLGTKLFERAGKRFVLTPAGELYVEKARKMLELKNNFEETVLKAKGPVIVDFWAPWCGPCKMIAPILDEIAPEFAGKAKIVKINVDDNQLVAGQFGVRSIPTLLLFKNGQLVATQVGALPKNQLAAFINQHL